MIDAKNVVHSYLRAQSALTAIVGSRIYHERLPEDFTIAQAVVFSRRGGVTNPYSPDLLEPSFQFKCYGSTAEDAEEVYRALYDALQGIENQTVGSDEILSAIEEVQGQDLRDPETDWPFVLTFFQFMVR